MLFLSCLKATELIEKKMHVRISLSKRMQLSAHKMMCDACTNYEKQSLIIEKGLAQKPKEALSQKDLENLKLEISKKLESAE